MVMRYENLTPEKMKQILLEKAPTTLGQDGVWNDWPHSIKPKPIKRVKSYRIARYEVAQGFKAGSGRYS
jgi:hypothetical protein